VLFVTEPPVGGFMYCHLYTGQFFFFFNSLSFGCVREGGGFGGVKLSDIFGTGCTFWFYARFLHRPGPLGGTSLFFRLKIQS
jgi:hypothetical protein